MKSDYIFSLIGVLAGLLGVYVGFRYYIYYRSLIYPGARNQEKNRRISRRAQILMLVSGLIFTGSLVNLFVFSETVTTPPAIATSTPGEAAGQPSSAPGTLSPLVPTVSSESSPTPEVITGTGFARIGNTNSFGVNVRSEPGLNFEMLAQLSDGSRVELTGEAQSADGFTWQRVRLEDGRLGWIADNFLIPEP